MFCWQCEGQSREQSSSTGFAPKGRSDNGRTTEAQPKDQRWAAAIKGDLLNAKDITTTSLHLKCAGVYSRMVREQAWSCLSSSLLPAARGPNVPSPAVTRRIQTVRNVWTINATLALAEWPGNCGTSHHTLQLILASTSCIWHPFFLWFISFSINFCTMECKAHFCLLPRHLWCQMDIHYCGKVGNLTSTFCFQNDSCLYVQKCFKKPLQVNIL